VALAFNFEHSVTFSPESATEILRAIPALPGVFALHGPSLPGKEPAQPYLTRAADVRRRITRMLAPPEPSADGRPVQNKRLNLRDRVARIDYTVTGSEFESTLTLYHASAAIFGFDEARRRLKLRTPFFLRFTADNAYPRVYSTNRLSKRALANFYGPFPSRAAADRYCDAVLDLFKLRRCVEDLAPYPEHPGCVYQEMKKCLAPCNQACTPEGAAAYSAEAAAVKRFFDTRGESMIVDIGLAREVASNALHFERAAELHAQWHKVKATQALADELVRPIPNLRAILIQKAAPPTPQKAVILSEAKDPCISPEPSLPHIADSDEPSAAIFLLHAGCIAGPERLSTLGVRAVKEQTSVGSSLFAQPLMLQAIPLAEPATDLEESHPANIAPDLSATEPAALNPTLDPEARAIAAITMLEQQATTPTDIATLSDHLSLLRRWYYRPEKQRTGEVFFPNVNHEWPIRRILNASARAALGGPKPMADTQRDLAQRNEAEPELQPTRTKVLHAGRPDVEREVQIVDKPQAFKSRRKSQST
jgi:excinuclease ABC subunit C